jgi:hypothetical protein
MVKDDTLSKSHLGGRCWHGPDRVFFYCAFVAAILPQPLFIIFICEYFVQYMTVAVYVVAVFLIFTSLVWFFIAAFSDPGIIPRGAAPPEDDNPFALEAKVPLVRKVMVKGIEADTKWCDTCFIYRPLRATHCSVCNNCVDKFDHHCPSIGNCVGRRNYRYFSLFVYTVTLDCIYVMTMSIIYIVLKADDYNNAHSRSTSTSAFHYAMTESAYFAIILPVYALAALCFVGGLAGFHCFLTGSGMTTNEYIKKSFKRDPNPHSAGFCKNFIRVLCGPFYPSLMAIRYKQHRSKIYTSTATVINTNTV